MRSEDTEAAVADEAPIFTATTILPGRYTCFYILFDNLFGGIGLESDDSFSGWKFLGKAHVKGNGWPIYHRPSPVQLLVVENFGVISFRMLRAQEFNQRCS